MMYGDAMDVEGIGSLLPSSSSPNDSNNNPNSSSAQPPPPPPSEGVQLVRANVSQFLQRVLSDDIVPESSRVIVLDSRLTLRTGFKALLETHTPAAPIWNPKYNAFIGTLAVSDFADILYYFGTVSTALPRPDPRALSSVLDSNSILHWITIKNQNHSNTCQNEFGGNTLSEIRDCVLAEESLYCACRILRDQSIAQIPIYCKSENIMLYILTHMSIFQFMQRHLALDTSNHAEIVANSDNSVVEALSVFDVSISELGIGTYGELASVSYSEKVWVALELMSSRRVSALPVVDEHGMILDEYTRLDVCQMVVDPGSISVEMTIGDSLRHFRQSPVQVCTCRRTDSLRQIFHRFDHAQTKRLYCLSDEGELFGVVSLSDLLGYFLD
uniref:CBS domain-containing protein n=1 Tax=Timspurckia oligopyrenoides TaxID=708627 RepID=A0A7S0ZJK5_9RHOD